MWRITSFFWIEKFWILKLPNFFLNAIKYVRQRNCKWKWTVKRNKNMDISFTLDQTKLLRVPLYISGIAIHGGSHPITRTVPLIHSVFRKKKTCKVFMWDILLSTLMHILIHNQGSNALAVYKNRFKKYLVSLEIFDAIKTGFEANIWNMSRLSKL